MRLSRTENPRPPAAVARSTRLGNYVTIVARRINKSYLPLIEAKNVKIARAHTHVSRSAKAARGALPRDGARASPPSWIDRRRRVGRELRPRCDGRWYGDCVRSSVKDAVP